MNALGIIITVAEHILAIGEVIDPPGEPGAIQAHREERAPLVSFAVSLSGPV